MLMLQSFARNVEKKKKNLSFTHSLGFIMLKIIEKQTAHKVFNKCLLNYLFLIFVLR